jgi:hypothetical protein
LPEVHFSPEESAVDLPVSGEFLGFFGGWVCGVLLEVLRKTGVLVWCFCGEFVNNPSWGGSGLCSGVELSGSISRSSSGKIRSK